jgi:acyl transferase domain-containing protein
MSVVARSAQEAVERLVNGGTWSGLADENAAAKVAFLFSGQGSQYPGMGRQLYEIEPSFREALHRCDDVLRPVLNVSLVDLLYGPPERAALLERTEFTQPALFALEWSLAEVWERCGVTPAAVLGHSAGELAAACRAGVFSLEDGLRLAMARGRCMEQAARGGAMAAVFAPRDQVAAMLGRYAPGELTIASLNGPTETVISGTASAVDAAVQDFHSLGVKCRRLRGHYAFHSPLLDPILDAFETEAAAVHYSAPKIPVVSNLTGRIAVPADMTNAQYWRRQARQAVQFAAGLETLGAAGYQVFVEIGPEATLAGIGARTSLPAVWLPSLRRDSEDWAVLLETLGRLYVSGVSIDWQRFHRGESHRRVSLPTYPFERQRFWVDSETETTTISAASPAYVGDHRLHGMAVVPGAHYLAMALSPSRPALRNVIYARPLALGDGEARALQMVTTQTGFRVSTLDNADWTLHATGEFCLLEASSAAQQSFEQVRARCADAISGAAFYEEAARRGLAFGPSLQWIEQIWRGSREAASLIRRPPGASLPGLLDAAQQLVAALLPGGTTLYLPLTLERVEPFAAAPDSGWAHAQLRDSTTGDVQVYDRDGQLVLSMRGVAFAGQSVSGWLQRIEWEAQPLPSPAVVGEKEHWLVVGDEGGLASQLNALGHEVKVVERGADFASLDLQCDGVVYVAAAEEVAEQSLVAPLRLTQAVLRQAKMPRLWWVTHGEMGAAAAVGIRADAGARASGTAEHDFRSRSGAAGGGIRAGAVGMPVCQPAELCTKSRSQHGL